MFIIIIVTGCQHVLLCKNLTGSMWSRHKTQLYFFPKGIYCCRVPQTILEHTNEWEIYQDFFFDKKECILYFCDGCGWRNPSRRGRYVKKSSETQKHWKKVSSSWGRRLFIKIILAKNLYSYSWAHLRKKLYEILLGNICVCFSHTCYWFAEPLHPGF